MSHCISLPSEAIEIAQGIAKVHMVPAATDNISWLIEYTSGQVAVIDGPSLEPILKYCAEYQLIITHLLNTHIHGDHIGVNHHLPSAMKQQPHLFSTEVEVWGAEATEQQIPHITRSLKEGDVLVLGKLNGLVWLTEGHIDGHISFLFWARTGRKLPVLGDQCAVFCGDTLFAAGCGRLFDGPAEKMYMSLQRLCDLPEDTLLFPAHEYTLDNLGFAHFALPHDIAIERRLAECDKMRSEGRSTLPTLVGQEQDTNPFVKAKTVEHFATLRDMKDRAIHRA
jgi:hydroxyacylglutathione hydrolase